MMPASHREVRVGRFNKGTLLGTPNREPQEYSRNIMEYKDPGTYIPIICLLYSWGSLFGVPSRVPLFKVHTFSCWAESSCTFQPV